MNNWYLNRLRTFSIPEFPYRLKQLASKYVQRTFQMNRRFPPQEISFSSSILDKAICNEKKTDFPFEIFGKQFSYQKEIDWHKDLFSGKSFPLQFSKNIDIKSDPDLSAKVVWEVNRMQFLPGIAFECRKSGRARDLEKFMEIIASWQRNNPYLMGINWYSNIEVNLRLITWFLCWEAMDAEKVIESNPAFKEFTRQVWIPLIYQHCLYSYQNPSKFSSANNHLISEYAGLFIASSKWKFRQSEKWLEYSQKGLESEMLRQHSPNGINKEEAAEYIQFITDFFLLAYLVGENTHRPFSEPYKQRLYQIFDYICHFLDARGNFPKYGDEDDGKCFILDFDPAFNNFRSLLTSGAILFGSPWFKSKSNGLDAKNLFLFGLKGKKEFDLIAERTPESPSKFYEQEGHFIFRHFAKGKEIYLHLDAAPLGYLSIAAHGHADALSFILHLDGQPFLVDPGTYSYHTERSWRNYFIGTLAHNTIRINKENQALSGGPTLWLNHYQTKVLEVENSGHQQRVKATHNGYKKWNITHTREIIFDKTQPGFRIIDTIDSGKGDNYLIELPFHLHPSLKITAHGPDGFSISDQKNNQIKLNIDSRLDAKIFKGQAEPGILGWYSPSFMIRQPAQTILCTLEGKGVTILETTISINQNEN